MIVKVKTQIITIGDAVVMSADIKFEGQPLTKLAPSTQDEVLDIIVKSLSKSCEPDHLPTYLLKEVLKYLLPFITAIINKSLVSGYPAVYSTKTERHC